MATYFQKVRRLLCFPGSTPGGPPETTAGAKSHGGQAGIGATDFRSEAHPALSAPLASSTPSAPEHPPCPPTTVCLAAAPGVPTAPEPDPPSDNEGMGKAGAASYTRRANMAQLGDGVDLVTEMEGTAAAKSARTSRAFAAISASDTAYRPSETGGFSGGSSVAFAKPGISCSGADAAMRLRGSPAVANRCPLSGCKSMPDARKLPLVPPRTSRQPPAAGRVCMTVSRARSCSIELSRLGSSRCVSGEMMEVIQRYTRLAQAGKPKEASGQLLGSSCSKSATPLTRCGLNASGRLPALVQAQELAGSAVRRYSGYTGSQPPVCPERPMSGIEKMGMILQLHQQVRDNSCRSQPVQSLWQQQQQRQQVLQAQAQAQRQARSQSSLGSSQIYCSLELGKPSGPAPTRKSSLSQGLVYVG